MIFQRQDIHAAASRNIAPGLPATPGERAAIDAEVFAETSMSLSAPAALDREYEKYLDDIEADTGKRLFNPIRLKAAGRPGTVEDAEEKFIAERDKLLETFPNIAIRSPGSIRADIGAQRNALRSRQADITRRSLDPLTSIAGFAATAGMAVIDPPVLLSMAFGAPFSAGILRGALLDAAIGAGVEIPIQAFVQLGRREFDEKPSLLEGAANVAAAGAGGFALSALLRGGVRAARPLARGTRELLRRSERLEHPDASVRAAQDYLRRQADLEEASPFGDTPAARAEHAERLSEAQEAVRAGRAPDIPERPRHPVRKETSRSRPKVSPDDETVPVLEEFGRAARAEALERFELGEREKAAILTVTPFLDDPAELGKVLNSIRRPKAVKAKTLRAFLRKRGGIRDDDGELTALGIEPKTMPGLLRQDGQALDNAGREAFEAGFFREEPTKAEFLDALDEEINRGRNQFRDADAVDVAERDALTELGDTLSDAGVDLQRMKNPEAISRLREIRDSLAVTEPQAPVARAEFERVDALADRQDELDAAIEAEVRDAYEGRGDEMIWTEADDGLAARMTVDDMINSFERDAADLDALRICVGGGRA